MVRPDTSSDGELEVLGFGQALSCEVSGVEAGKRKDGLGAVTAQGLGGQTAQRTAW